MSEFDQMYREVILDHYKNPRGHGELEDADAHADGQNPLCGDEVSIYVAFAEDGETIDEVKFSGRGCAISQAATSMLTEMVQGKSATEVATLDKQALLDEIAIALSPVRLKCALLGLTSRVRELDVAPADEFPPGSVKLVTVAPGAFVGVYNCGGQLYAIEDRCSHDDGPLCEGEWDESTCRVVCPRHGSAFDLQTGQPLSLPAYVPVETYPVKIVDGVVRVELPEL